MYSDHKQHKEISYLPFTREVIFVLLYPKRYYGIINRVSENTDIRNSVRSSVENR